MYEEFKLNLAAYEAAKKQLAQLEEANEVPIVGIPYRDALSAEEIECQLMDSAVPKTSMEWWARHEIESLRAHIAKLKAAIEPFRRVKGITSIYEYVPIEALRDDEEFNFKMNGAEMKTIYALLKGEK